MLTCHCKKKFGTILLLQNHLVEHKITENISSRTTIFRPPFEDKHCHNYWKGHYKDSAEQSDVDINEQEQYVEAEKHVDALQWQQQPQDIVIDEDDQEQDMDVNEQQRPLVPPVLRRSIRLEQPQPYNVIGLDDAELEAGDKDKDEDHNEDKDQGEDKDKGEDEDESEDDEQGENQDQGEDNDDDNDDNQGENKSMSEVDLDEEINQLLSKACLRYLCFPAGGSDSELGLIVCTDCKKGIKPTNALSHSRRKHNIKVSKDNRNCIEEFILATRLVDRSASIPRHPHPNQAPIQYLQIKKGYSCTKCNHCCPKEKSMQIHWSKRHKGLHRIIHPTKRSRQAHIQSYFLCNPHYFRVNQLLAKVSSRSLYALYISQYADCIEECSMAVGKPALTTLEIPPILQLTQWHEHLKAYIGNPSNIHDLCSLMRPPSRKETKTTWLGDQLHTTIAQYMRAIASQAKTSTLKVRELLMECPR